MKVIKVSEATNEQLDWLVATYIAGYQAVYTNGQLRPVFRKGGPVEETWPAYTASVGQLMPIIFEREVSLIAFGDNVWEAKADHHPNGGWAMDEGSALVAGARCLIVSEVGERVRVPEDL